MKNKHLPVQAVIADADGNIYVDPHLLMLCRRGHQWGLPRPDELTPLPKESELFFLPGRKAVGLDPDSGETEILEDLAVAAFVAPAYTLSAHPAYIADKNAPLLPLFAYGSVGFAQERFYVCAKRVDQDPRQDFSAISKKTIAKKSKQLLLEYPQNRLVAHILNNCVARYDCPAARNFALGRYEAPLPTSTQCNARCVGCISEQAKDSPIKTTPQCRLQFVPSAKEIAQVMHIHASREKTQPIFSFGQGCEGDPLTNANLLAESIALFRTAGGHGTINCNTNASNPNAILKLARAGLTSIRVSLNSARPELYLKYYRPQGYTFEHVVTSMHIAHEAGLFISLNLLYFPGLTDTEEELAALSSLIAKCGVNMIQWRNLNIDPEWYFNLMQEGSNAPSMGLHLFMKRLKKLCPALRYGYFNPYLGDRYQPQDSL